MAYYSIDEQETVIVFEQLTRTFDVFTTVPKHIRRLENKKIGKVLDIKKDSEGKTILLRLKLEKLPAAGVFNA